MKRMLVLALLSTVVAAAEKPFLCDVSVPNLDRLAPPKNPPAVYQPEILVLLARIDDNSAAYPDSVYRQKVDQLLQEFNSFMWENSYGRVWYNFKVVGPFVVPSSLCGVDTAVVHQGIVLRETALAADAQVDFSTVRQMLVLIDEYNEACPTLSSGSMRAVRQIPTAEGFPDTSVAWVTGVRSGGDSYGIVHEYAHTLGAVHNEANLCVAKSRYAVDHQASPEHEASCAVTWDTYIDPMCGGWPTHFSSVHKRLFGWIRDSEETLVTSAGIYALGALENDVPVKSIRVPIANSNFYHSYVLEYRTRPMAPVSAGVYLWADYTRSGFAMAELIEPPPFMSETEYSTKPLEPGVPFDDSVTGVRITLMSTPQADAQLFIEVP